MELVFKKITEFPRGTLCALLREDILLNLILSRIVLGNGVRLMISSMIRRILLRTADL